eukprot:scpid70903/ scgid35453/ Protein SON; Negative regulatory element-binding protein
MEKRDDEQRDDAIASRKRKHRRDKSPGEEKEEKNDDERVRRHHKKKHHKRRHDPEKTASDGEDSLSRRRKKKRRHHHRRQRQLDSSEERAGERSVGNSSHEEVENNTGDEDDNNDVVPVVDTEACAVDPHAVEVKSDDTYTVKEPQEAVDPTQPEPETAKSVGGDERAELASNDAAGPARKMAGFLPARLSLPKAVVEPISQETDDVWNDCVTGVSLSDLEKPAEDGTRTQGADTSSSPTEVTRSVGACTPDCNSASPVHASSCQGNHHHPRYHEHGDESGKASSSRHRHRPRTRSCSCESWSASPSPKSRSSRGRRGDRRSRSPRHRGRRRHAPAAAAETDAPGASPQRGSHRVSSYRSGHRSSPPRQRTSRSSKSYRSRSPSYRRRSSRYRSSSRTRHTRDRSQSPRRYRSRSPRRNRSRSPRRYRLRTPRRSRSISPRRYRSRSPRRRPERSRSRSPRHSSPRSPRRYRSQFSRSPPGRSRFLARYGRDSPPASPSQGSSKVQSPERQVFATNTDSALVATSQQQDSASSGVVGQVVLPTGLARFTNLCSKISSKRSDDEHSSDGETSRPVRHPFALPSVSSLAKAKAGALNRSTDTQLAITAGNSTQTGSSSSSLPSGFVNISEIVAQVRARNPVVLRQSFPVSTGVKHVQAEESPATDSVQVDPSAPSGRPAAPLPPVPQLDTRLVIRHGELQKRLELNPHDFGAISELARIKAELSQFAVAATRHREQQMEKGHLQPLQPLPKSQLEAGTPAWARKDMFSNLNPVREGFGAKMLRKQGWSLGQPLGKMGDGYVEPVQVVLKTDRKGLASHGEGPGRKSSSMSVLPNMVNGRGMSVKSAAAAGGSAGRSSAGTGGGAVTSLTLASMTGQGKHPVSVLMEHCSRKRIPAPDYSLCLDSGPQHSKCFKFAVTIQGVQYTSPAPLNNKKHAKAAAALAAVQALGLV